MLDAPWICFLLFTVVSWVYVVLGCGKFGIFFLCVYVLVMYRLGFFLASTHGVKSMQDVAFSHWPVCI